jgi:hypothetical protein
MLKNHTSMKEILHRQNSVDTSPTVSDLLLYASSSNCQRALVDELGMIRTQMDAQEIRNGHSARILLCGHPMTVTGF